MLGLLTISATGMQDANLRLHASAHNIAALNAPTPVTVNEVTSEARPDGQGVQSYIQTRESVFGIDLVTEAMNTQLALHSLKANAQAMKTANDAVGTVLDMVNTDESSR